LSRVFKKILNEPQHRSQRYAIMPHLLGGTREDVLFDDDDIRAGLVEIHGLWDKRLKSLKKVGWKPQARCDMRTLYNCPPPFAVGRPRRQCRRYKLCPFCWARLVAMPLYRRTEAMLFPDCDQSTKASREFSLFEKVEYEYLPRQLFTEPPDDVELRFTAEGAVAHALSILRKHRLDLKKATGSFHMVSLDPANPLDGVPQDWRLKHRVLAVLPRKFPMEKLPATAGEVNTATDCRAAPVSKETLAAVIGRVCAYPGGLFKEQAESVAEILEAQAGSRGMAPRLSVYYGALIERR
jgi:hypothetical protein